MKINEEKNVLLSNGEYPEIEISGCEKMLKFVHIKTNKCSITPEFAKFEFTDCEFKDLYFEDVSVAFSQISGSKIHNLNIVRQSKSDNGAFVVCFQESDIENMRVGSVLLHPISSLVFSQCKIKHLLLENGNFTNWEFIDTEIDILEVRDVRLVDKFNLSNVRIKKVVINGQDCISNISTSQNTFLDIKGNSINIFNLN